MSGKEEKNILVQLFVVIILLQHLSNVFDDSVENGTYILKSPLAIRKIEQLFSEDESEFNKYANWFLKKVLFVISLLRIIQR